MSEKCDTSFVLWWKKVDEAASGLIKDGVNSTIILGAWTLWNHRNRCVFDGAAPNLAGRLMSFADERRLWVMVGTRGLSLLTAPLPGD